MMNHQEPLWGLFSLGCIAAIAGIAATHFIKNSKIILFMLPLHVVFLMVILIGNIGVVYLPVISLLFFYMAQYLLYKKIRLVSVLLIFGSVSYIISFLILPQYLLRTQQSKISPNKSISFTYKSNDGKSYKVSGQKPIIIEYWNSGCSNCFKKMYMLDELQNEIKGDCEILCVYADYEKGVKDNLPEYINSLNRTKHRYNLSFAYDSLYYHYDKNIGLPQTLIVSPRGKILYSDAGYITGNKRAIMNKYKSVIKEYSK